MVATDWVLIKGNDRPEWETISKEEINVINITRQLLYRNPINHSSVMFRAEQIKKIGGYDINRSSQFDYDLWVRAVEAKFLLGKIPLKLASKRIHADQSFENKRRIKYLISSHKVQYRAIKMLNGNITHYILFIVRFFYGLLPRFIRSIITHFLSKK